MNWVVETEGTELPTPHPVIEPVSHTRVRNGIFRCRDRRVKLAFRLAETDAETSVDSRKARVPRDKPGDIGLSAIPMNWVVGAPGLEPGTR
jgi:hypothetical protein